MLFMMGGSVFLCNSAIDGNFVNKITAIINDSNNSKLNDKAYNSTETNLSSE